MLRLEPFRDKWLSSGWDVYEVNGHDLKSIYDVLILVSKSNNGKPQCIIANTKKGQGLDYTVDKPLMHGFMPHNEDEIERAFKELKY